MKRLQAVIRAQRAGYDSKQLIGATISAVVLGALGWWNTETLIAAPTDIATIKLRGELPRGQTALEAAFWIAVVLSNVLAFRSLEIFLRDRAARMFRDLPIEPSTVFLARLVVLGRETALLALVSCSFFAPLLLVDPKIAVNAMGVVAFGLLVSSFTAIGCILYVGIELGGGKAMAGDAYGGVGAAFVYGPVLGFAASALLCLLVKLGFGEWLRSETVTNAFIVAVSAAVGVALFAVLSALRTFRSAYHALAASFEEADNTTFDLGQMYQTSVFPGDSLVYSWFGSFARTLQIQYRRRFPVARLFERAWIAVAAVFFATRPADAIPDIAVMITILLPFGLLANPWQRVAQLPGDRFLVGRSTWNNGVAATATFEILIHATALVLGLIGIGAFREMMDIAFLWSCAAAIATLTCCAFIATRGVSLGWSARLICLSAAIGFFVTPVAAVLAPVLVTGVLSVSSFANRELHV